MFPAVFVIFFGLAFLSFTQFLLLTLPAVPCFFSSYFFILVFMPIFLYKRIWAFMGQIILTGLKGSWAQFVFICWNHSAGKFYFAAKLYFAADLYFIVNNFPFHFFLWTSLALWSSWRAFRPCFSLGFPPYGLLGMYSKNGHQHSAPWAYGLPLQFICENLCSFLSRVISQLTTQSLLSSGKSFSFFLQIYDPPRVAKKLLFRRVVVSLLSPQSKFVKNFASL